jgi:hypothetical protein
VCGLQEVIDGDVFESVFSDCDSFAVVSKMQEFEDDYDPRVYCRSGREVFDAVHFTLGSELRIAIATDANQI